MPYSKISDLPDTVKGLPADGQKVWMSVFNSADKDGKDETTAIKIAWGAVKNAGYSKTSTGKWVKLSNSRQFMNMFSEIILSNDETEPGEENKINAKIPVLRKSRFKHWLYGDLNFDDNFFNRLINNFYAGTLGFDASIDLIHKPDLGAVGWVRDLVYENDTLTLMVEMLEEGVRLVKEGKFKYASISVDDEYEDSETGEKFGPVLMGAALTNRPFINRQNAVTLLSMDDFSTGQIESTLIGEDIKDFSILEDTMTEKDKQEVQNDEPKIVQLDISEFNTMRAELEELKKQTEKTLALELERDKLNTRMSELQTKYETAENEKLLSMASARIEEGNRLAPVVVDFARKMLKFEKLSEQSVELSKDGSNIMEWVRSAVKEMLFSFPCTLPVEPNTINASQDNPNSGDLEAKKNEELQAEIQNIWKL